MVTSEGGSDPVIHSLDKRHVVGRQEHYVKVLINIRMAWGE
jgi:hypothetical protein